MLRTRQHQVKFQMVIGCFCPLLAQRAIRRQRVKGNDLLLQMVCSRIPQQRQRAVLIAWPECGQQGVILAQPGLFVPRHTMLRTVLQTGQRFLEFRQRVQAQLQRLILSGGKCGLGIRTNNLAAVGDISDAHPHSPAHHRKRSSRCHYLAPWNTGLARTQPGRKRPD